MMFINKKKKNTSLTFDKKLLKKMAKFLNFNNVSIEGFGYGSTAYRVVFKNRPTLFPKHDSLYVSTSIYVDNGTGGDSVYNIVFYSGQDAVEELETIAMEEGKNICATNSDGKDVVLWPKNMSKEEAEIRLDLLIVS